MKRPSSCLNPPALPTTTNHHPDNRLPTICWRFLPRRSASNHPPPHHPTTEPTIGRRALLPRYATPVPMSYPSITPAHCSAPPWPQCYPLASATHRYRWRTTTATMYFLFFILKFANDFSPKFGENHWIFSATEFWIVTELSPKLIRCKSFCHQNFRRQIW